MNVTAGRLTPGQDLARPARAATLPMVDVIDMPGANEQDAVSKGGVPPWMITGPHAGVAASS
jgi:hypothetical protein